MVSLSSKFFTLSCLMILFFACCNGISVSGTTEAYNSKGAISITRHSNCRSGDLMVLFVHRTDDDLPVLLSGWKRIASVFKKNNGWRGSTAEDCQSWHKSGFCQTFKNSGGDGHDLAQVAYVKTAGSQTQFSFDLDGNINGVKHPGWAILTCLRGADNNNPVRNWAFSGRDGSIHSKFPAVNANSGDLILLSQSFDDKVSSSVFQAPRGFRSEGYVAQSDESAFLFSKTASNGNTGTMITTGPGHQGASKDALLTIAIRAAGSSSSRPSPPSNTPSGSGSGSGSGKCGYSGSSKTYKYPCEGSCSGTCDTGKFGTRKCSTCHSSVSTRSVGRSASPSGSSSEMCGYSGSRKVFHTQYECTSSCSKKSGCANASGRRRHCGTCGGTWQSAWIGLSSATSITATQETSSQELIQATHNVAAGGEKVIILTQATADSNSTLAVAAIVIGSVALFLSLVLVIFIARR